MGHIELSMLVYNPIFIKIVTDILRMTCLNCFRLQIGDNMIKVISLQLRLVDAGYITEAQDIEIFKSEVVATKDGQDDESKLKEYEDLLERGLLLNPIRRFKI